MQLSFPFMYEPTLQEEIEQEWIDDGREYDDD